MTEARPPARRLAWNPHGAAPKRTGAPRRSLMGAIAAALLLAGTALQAQSLTELLEAARAHDASYLAAKADAEATLRRADQARALVLPRAALGSSVTTSRIDPAGAPSSDRTGYSFGLSASHPLYNQANRIGAEQGALQVDLAQAGLDAAEQDLIVRVAQAYFDVLAARDTLTSIQARKAAIAEQLASARRNFEVGTATITDAREAQAQFDLTVAQEIAAENALLVRRLALQQLVGRPSVQPWRLPDSIVLPGVQPADLNSWRVQAEQSHPAVRQARTAFEIARLEVDRARAGHLPTVDLVASLQRSDNGAPVATGQGGPRTDASVGVQLNLPLFTGYATENRIKETVALQERARNTLEGAVRTVNQATQEAFFGVESTQSQVKALEAAEDSSRLALEATRLGYEVGVRVNLDVLNAQAQLFNTQRDLKQARYNVLLTELRLRLASGQLDAAALDAVSRLLVP